MPEFFTKRTLWLPSLWGVFVISIFIIATTVFTFRYMACYLSKNQAIHANYLVVEGWLNEPELLEAINEFKSGRYKLLITTGGPDTRQVNPEYNSFADKAAAFIRSTGFDKKQLLALPASYSPQDRTYLSANMVRLWFEKNESEVRLNIFSSGVHARRTHLLYKKVFKQNSEIGVIAAKSNEYDVSHWWRTSIGAKSVLTETIAFAWTLCCFTPPEMNEKKGG